MIVQEILRLVLVLITFALVVVAMKIVIARIALLEKANTVKYSKSQIKEVALVEFVDPINILILMPKYAIVTGVAMSAVMLNVCHHLFGME